LDKFLCGINQKLEEEDQFRLVREIASGLLHLHKHNIIHGNLAARNILLTGRGDIKIAVRTLFESVPNFLHVEIIY
jgi:serine/threonine protein kinase